jgi:type IV pilus assembly protein PilM
MFAKNKSLVGLDIGSSMVKAVEFAFDRGNIVLTGYGSAPVRSLENVEPAIREALSKGRISGKRVCTSVSGRRVVVRYFPVGAAINNEQALRQTVDEQAPNFIPFNLNEVEKDFFPVESREPSGTVSTKVILVAAKNEEIEDRVRAIRNCGLIPHVIDIDTFALGNAFEFWCQRGGVNISNKVTGLVDVGATKTTINILAGKDSSFSREVYIGSKDMATAISKRVGQSENESEEMLRNPGDNYDMVRDAVSATLEDIGNEIRLSIDFYENQFEAEVNEIYVSGGITRFPGLVELLGQIFYLPTQTWNPIQGIPVAGDVDQKVLQAEAPHLAVAVGLASRVRGARK